MSRSIAIGLLMGVLSLPVNVTAQTEAPVIIADWTFEEGTPGSEILTAGDQSGNGHALAPLVPRDGIPPGPNPQFVATGTVADGAVSGKFTRSEQGVGSTLATAQSPDFNLGDEFTIEFSLKSNSPEVAMFEVVMLLSTPQGHFYGINYDNGGISFLGVDNEGSWQVPGSTWLTDGPHHVAFVGKSNTLSIYVDTILRGSGPLRPALAGDNGARVYLGGNDVGHHGFNGIIDRLRIARKALTPGEFFRYRKISELILEPLVSQVVEEGSRAVLRVGADASAGPLTYEWTFRSTFDVSSTARPIDGANSDTLVVDPVERLDDGVYSVRVSNSQGISSSSSALLSVGRTMPIIQTGPISQAVSPGSSVQFTVEAYNDRWMSYAWLFNGVEIPGENSPTLVLNNVQAANAGRYAAMVRTPTWTLVSPDAVLTVLGTDTVPPVISITSPTAGVVDRDRITVAGTLTDDIAVSTATLEHNGQVIRTFNYPNFTFPELPLLLGTNVFTIRATDHAGNASTSEVVVIYQPERFLSVPVESTAQEGGYITLPIMFQSNGEVGGIEFYFGYWSNRLSAPKITWLVEKEGARGELVSEFGRFRASFHLAPGETLPAGNIQLAEIRFKTLSLPEPFFARFEPKIIAVRSSTEELFTTGNGAFGGGITITLREITADNNANDRLDIGDAAAIRRRLAGLDTLQPYDITGNDLNGDQALDTEDAMRVLRTVVGVDSPPQAPAAAALSAKSLRASAAGGLVRLTADAPEIRPGQKVKVSVLLEGNERPLEGASFKLEYPVSALRLDRVESHQVGAMVPEGASTLWNVSPSQNDYAAQNGVIYLATCSAAHWADTNGTLAEFSFTVQSGAALQQSWPVRLSRVELSHEADLETFSGNEIVLATAPELPAITTQPASQSVLAGEAVQFSVTAASTAPLTYSWFFKGVEIPGENSSTLSLPAVQPSDEGTYKVEVRNSAGATVSEDATLTVVIPDLEGPVIVITAPSERITSNNRITLEGSISDAGGIRSATLNRDGVLLRELAEGPFSVPDVALSLGTNVFTIRAVDQAGNTTVVEAVVVFEREGAPARLSVGGYNHGDGTFEMEVSGEAGFRYRIDQSDDLKAWTEMQTVVATSGPSVISDGSAAGKAIRFYRAVPIK